MSSAAASAAASSSYITDTTRAKCIAAGHLDTYVNDRVPPGVRGGLLAEDKSIHLGIRGPIYDKLDLVDDANFGLRIIRAGDLDVLGIDRAVTSSAAAWATPRSAGGEAPPARRRRRRPR